MQSILQHLRPAWRQLRHSPEVTVLAVVTLALGIGANTAMFTAVENILLRPLPYRDSDRLVNIVAAGGESAGALSWLDYLDVRDQSHALSSVGGYTNDVGVVQSNDGPVSVVTAEVTPNVFGMLGTPTLKGRTFTEEEGRTNGPSAVLISEGLWRQILGANPAVVGRVLQVNGKDRTIVGIMPTEFRFPESAGKDLEKGLWLPVQPNSEMLRERGYDFLTLLAKSRPIARLSQVQAELDAISKRIRDTDSRADRKLTFGAQSYYETITGPAHSVVLALITALGLVLIIACANVANLLIARGAGRQHEFAVRAALGSGSSHLVRLMIAEAGLLSLLGSGLGLLISYWITAAIHSLPAGTVPRSESIEIHWTVLLVLAAVATFTTMLSALLPALSIIKTDAQAVLRTGVRSVGSKGFGSRAGVCLVAGEVALSVLLLIAAGLLFRTLWGLEHARLGFDVTGVTSFVAMPTDASGFGNVAVAEPGNVPSSVATTVYFPLLEGLRHTPGFQDAALITAPPFSGFDLQTSFRIAGRPRAPQQNLSTRLTALSGRYQELMSTPTVSGRSISEQDIANAPFVAAINETFARKYFAGKNAIGEQIDLGGRATGMIRPYTIVGVIGDQIDSGTSQAPRPLLMLPYQQIPPASVFYPALLKTAVYFVVKTRGGVPVAPAAHSIFRRTAPDLALDHFQTMQELVDQSNNNSRLGLFVIGAFAGLALLMVVAGLYGVLSQVVSQRYREFGLRMALGATRPGIARMVLARGSLIAVAGLAVGLALSLGLGRLIKAFLFGVTPFDPGAYAFAAVALLLVCGASALVPAWRAASFEPVKALRDE